MLVFPLLQGTEGTWGPVPSSLGEEAVPGSGEHLGVYVGSTRIPASTGEHRQGSCQPPKTVPAGMRPTQSPGHRPTRPPGPGAPAQEALPLLPKSAPLSCKP